MLTCKFAHGFKYGVLVLAFGGLAVSMPLRADEAHSFAQSREALMAEALGDAFDTQARTLVAEQARLIFYRPDAASPRDAVSLFVDGAYHASLITGAYTSICLQAASASLGVRRVSVAEKAKGGVDASIPMSLKRGKTLYLRVREGGADNGLLESVAEPQARTELARTRLQIHTLSRVDEAEECRFVERSTPLLNVSAKPATLQAHAAPVAALQSPTVQRPQPKAPAPQKLVLAGDTLFQSARGGRDRIGSQGSAELDRLLVRLRQEYSSIETLRVVGHTDPLGKDHLRASRHRAEDVLNYLLGHGLRAAKSIAEGRGFSDLLVNRCGNRPTPAAAACHKPNRRVVVEVSGLRR